MAVSCPLVTKSPGRAPNAGKVANRTSSPALTEKRQRPSHTNEPPNQSVVSHSGLPAR